MLHRNDPPPAAGNDNQSGPYYKIVRGRVVRLVGMLDPPKPS